MPVYPQVVDKAHLYPGMAIDGSNENPLWDTGIDVDTLPSTGRIYLPRSIIRDAARALPGLVAELAFELGYVAPEVHAAMIQSRDDDLEAAQRDVKALERLSLNSIKAIGEGNLERSAA